MNYMNMRLVKVNGKTREDLLVALASLGEMDCDFNGENGLEYLWETVELYIIISDGDHISKLVPIKIRVKCV